MSNSFLEFQCRSMLISLQAFEQACEMSVFQDDGAISKAEEKALKKLRKAAAAFRKELQKI